MKLARWPPTGGASALGISVTGLSGSAFFLASLLSGLGENQNATRPKYRVKQALWLEPMTEGG